MSDSNSVTVTDSVSTENSITEIAGTNNVPEEEQLPEAEAVPADTTTQPTLSRDEFASLMIEKAKEVVPDIEVDYDQQEYSLKHRSQEQQIMYLHNAYLEYTRVGEEEKPYTIKKWLRHFLFVKSLPEEFEDAVPDILPALRTRSYFELTQLRFRCQERDMPSFPYQDVGEFFGLTVSYDMHDSIAMISAKHLEDWGISFYEAMEIAIRNLSERDCAFTCLKVEGQMLVYYASNGDSFDGTRLILTDHIRSLEVYGDTIALVSNTDSLIITGSEDKLGLAFMLSQAIEGNSKPHALPPILLRLENDEWAPWLPPEESEFYWMFKRFQIIANGVDYAEQQSLLAKIHKKQGKDILIGTFFVAQRENSQSVFTYTVWEKDCDMLLPKAEYIAFKDGLDENGADRTAVIPWNTVLDTVDYMIKQQIDYPPRFLVSGYPSEKEINQMRQV
ncbi:MAG: hypothetical protein ACRC2T_18500 [Thermoguttaceae bacterium]